MIDSDLFLANLTAELTRIASAAEAIGTNKFKNEHRLARARYAFEVPSILVAAASGITSLVTDIPAIPATLAFIAAAAAGLNALLDPTRRRWGNKLLAARAFDLQHRAQRVLTLDVEPAASDRGELRPVSAAKAAELRDIVERLAREETALRSTRSEDAAP